MTAAPSRPPAPALIRRAAWLEIDLDALAGNVRALASVAAPAIFGAVVKADAYGHGLEATAGAAWGAGARYLCVATLDEALALRAAGHDGALLVTYAVPPDAIPEAVNERVEIVAGGESDVEALCAHMQAGRISTTPGSTSKWRRGWCGAA